jgi:hypothetical protein
LKKSDLRISCRPWEVPRASREAKVQFKKVIVFLNKLKYVHQLTLFNLDLNYDITLQPQFKWKILRVFNTGSSENISNFRKLFLSSDNNAQVIIDSSGYPNLLNYSLQRLLNEIAICQKIESLHMCVHSLIDPVKTPQFYEGLSTLNYIRFLTLEVTCKIFTKNS